MKTLLVLTDFSIQSEHAAGYALALALKTSAEIVLFHAYHTPTVVPVDGGIYPNYPGIEAMESDSTNRLKELKEKLTQNLTEGTISSRIHYLNKRGTIADNLRSVVADKGIWMIIMGDKGKRDILDRYFFGVDTSSVIEKSSCPVLLIPDKTEIKPIERIAFATDFATSEIKDLHYLISLAYDFNAEIILTHVFEHLDNESRDKGSAYYNKLKSDLNYFKINYEAIMGKNVPETLDKFVLKENIDILALAHKNHTLLERIFKSGTTKEMLKHHKVPLLIFPKNYSH